MNPPTIAPVAADRVAYVLADAGVCVTHGELEARSNAGAQLLRHLGLGTGDHIALMLENQPWFFPICWSAQRSGLYYTPISWRLQRDEVAYIVENCEAKVFITSAARRDVVAPLAPALAARGVRCYMVDGVAEGFASWEAALATMPTQPLADAEEGISMLYSSGTTGYPKGVRRSLPGVAFGSQPTANLLRTLYGADETSVYLSPAPLYHAAPLGFTMACLRAGTQVVVMEQFEAERALEYIERYRVTHAQWVPTMFVRMLKLPDAVRLRYDVSSLQAVVHAAAPCPVEIKERMIAWWGPIVYEYYAGTEGNGFVQCNSQEWLGHKGTVGRPLNCHLHICDEAGNELPVGDVGTIWFEGGGRFEYFKDAEKTAQSRHPLGWSTLGDVGYVDGDGYLYLTDRKHFMIISGGVNVYPQEAENALITHPAVTDVAVFGIPNDDFGEEVKAVVQPVDMARAGPALEAELIAWCRDRLSAIKCPRSIDFDAELPRHPTGKLYKRLLRDRYWQGQSRKI